MRTGTVAKPRTIKIHAEEGNRDMRLMLKGLLLGLLTGCLTTIGDDLVSVYHHYELAIPKSYPFVLISVNMLVWGSLGCLSGLFVQYLRRRITSSSFDRYEDLIWIFCYVCPFLVLYGLLGSLDFHRAVGRDPVTSAYDHYLSILWVVALLGILVAVTLARVRQDRSSPILFLPELVLIISVLYFFPNLNVPLYWDLLLNLGFPAGTTLTYPLCVLFFVSVYSLAVLGGLRHKKSLALGNWALLTLLLLIIPATAFSTFRLRQRTIPAFPAFDKAAKRFDERNLSRIILIVLDTARADRLSLYGYPKETAPNLSRFAKDSLLFANCYAASSWTIPSHASLFTGLYPSEHGVHYPPGENQKDRASALYSIVPLSRTIPNLIESLGERGYLTGAVVANAFILKPYFGFDRGFDYYNVNKNIGYIGLPFRPIAHVVCVASNSFHEVFKPDRIASHINAEVFAWLEQFSREPFALFINYMEPHGPYFPPVPFGRLFQTAENARVHRWLTVSKRRLGLTVEAEYEEYWGTQYDGETAYLDRELGSLFKKMKDLGIYDSSVIVVTSDHGELLGEHGLWRHNTHMFEELLKVPLLIKLPFSSRTGVVATPMQMVDILPTVFDTLDLPLPEGLSGTPYGLPEKPIVGEFFATHLEAGIHRVMYQENYKLMHYTESKDPELFDLVEDPHEAKNLSQEKEAVMSRLSEELSEWVRSHPPKRPRAGSIVTSPPKEVLDDLRALGYIK